jgi:hypothetical protein
MFCQFWFYDHLNLNIRSMFKLRVINKVSLVSRAFFSWNGIFDKGPQDEGLFSFKEVLKTVQ